MCSSMPSSPVSRFLDRISIVSRSNAPRLRACAPSGLTSAIERLHRSSVLTRLASTSISSSVSISRLRSTLLTSMLMHIIPAHRSSTVTAWLLSISSRNPNWREFLMKPISLARVSASSRGKHRLSMQYSTRRCLQSFTTPPMVLRLVKLLCEMSSSRSCGSSVMPLERSVALRRRLLATDSLRSASMPRRSSWTSRRPVRSTSTTSARVRPLSTRCSSQRKRKFSFSSSCPSRHARTISSLVISLSSR
mmetsp:Transcript_91/g.268  ORF Transcript_91/g.268 Transcript_91/m.268 type:complete len:249 (-) Transcript_91:1439-2185(-)